MLTCEIIKMYAMVSQVIEDSNGTLYGEHYPAAILKKLEANLGVLMEWIYSHGEKPSTD